MSPAFKAGGKRTIGAHIASSRDGRQILLRGLKVSEVKEVVRERYKDTRGINFFWISSTRDQPHTFSENLDEPI
jgi:hypothetical protein